MKDNIVTLHDTAVMKKKRNGPPDGQSHRQYRVLSIFFFLKGQEDGSGEIVLR